MRELRLRQHGQHIGLVFGRVDCAVQFVAVGRLVNPGVVTGADRVEAECDGSLEDGGELDALVAAKAGVGGAAGGVLGDEVVDDLLGEPLGDIPDVVRDAE